MSPEVSPFQVFTGQVPFYQYKQEFKVVAALEKGDIPRQPDPDVGNFDGNNDLMWKMMKMCWDRDPSKRPRCNDLHKDYFQGLEDHRAKSSLPVAAFQDAIKTSRKMDQQIRSEHILSILRKVRFNSPRSKAGT